MYMARSFMIHSSLNWTDHGSDDLALWSFAVDHAAWLYNRIPQRGSGIAPLEFITREREFYHRDLRRTHVWGCPAYVLEASLQDGKKIPKWNRRARMGQFLGFSRQHSSLVAMVRNLHTGYVSPQFHVVFDDKFDTIYTESKTDEELENICDELFVTNRDYYADPDGELLEDGTLIYKPPPLDEVWLSDEERRERKIELEKQRRRHELKERYLHYYADPDGELLEDGTLIYKPPPLDEVWLSDEERRDRKAELEKQCRRHELKERYLHDAVQSKSNSPMPDLVPDSDDESDDDNPSSDVDSRSEGDVLRVLLVGKRSSSYCKESETLNGPDNIPPITPESVPNS
ncbi:hypothetical protein ACHAXR_003041 [Thalassiosira sp. AJA248-18]